MTIAPTVGLGLAPSSGPSFLGGGGNLGVLVGLRPRAVVGMEARVLGTSSSGFQILRTRVAALGGLRLRKRSFELLALGRVFVEPWWVRSGGNAAPLLRGSELAARRPLLGAGLRMSPGVLLQTRQAQTPLLHLGARIDVDGSLVPDQGGRSVLLSAETATGATPFARLGGIELALGLDLTLWF